jgi:hypothetical protein
MKENARSGRLECSGCGSLSFSDAPQCTECGRDLGVLDAMFARATGGPAYWLRQTREEAAAIKAREEEASQARLAEMWAAEQRRLEDRSPYSSLL